MISHATDSNFAFFVQHASFSLPVLVDFHATWCGPCKNLGPLLEQLNAQLSGKAQIVQVDLDSAPHTAIALAVKSVPTLLLFKGGKIVSRYIGNPGSVGAILSLFGPEMGL